METTVVEMKQKSLAESKKKVQKPLKNVLSSPFADYWQPIQDNDLKYLIKSFKKYLPELKKLKTNIPWEEAKKFTKQERQKMTEERKQKIFEDEDNKELLHQKSFLTFGFNEVNRYLSQDQLSCIVIEGNSNSKRMGLFLVNAALVKNTPVVICPGLSSIVKEKVGFKCLALGIKESIKNENIKTLKSLQNDIIKNFTKPNIIEPILCDRLKVILDEIQTELESESLQTSKKGTTSLEEDNVIKNLTKKFKMDCEEEMNETEIKGSGAIEIKEELIEDTIETMEVDSDANRDIYLYRTNNSYRVFVPTISKFIDEPKHLKSSKISEEFITVSSSSEFPVSSRSSSSDFPVSSSSSGDFRKKGKRFAEKRLAGSGSDSKLNNDFIFIDTDGDLVKSPVVKKVKSNPKRVNNNNKKKKKK